MTKWLDYDEAEERLRVALKAGDLQAIDEAGAVLDALDAERTKPALLPSALWYASQGLHVFPLQPGAKTPMPRSHGCKDASTDLELIKEWWADVPTANIGIATGHVVDVIDIDGPGGVASWAKVADSLPTILGIVSTPRAGGSHLYVAATGQGNRAGIFPGIDYRGAGGYVVAPPSVNAEGVGYRWTRPLNLDLAG